MESFSYKQSMKMTVASVPLVLALILLVPLAISQNALIVNQQGLKLSPVRDNVPIILSLLGFMLGYILLMGIFFSKDLKEWFHQMNHKPESSLRHVSVRKKR